MPKFSGEVMSAEEFSTLPCLFGVPTLMRIVGASRRYVTKNAEKFGGQKVAGRWTFSKAQVARRYGIDLEDTTEEVGMAG